MPSSTALLLAGLLAAVSPPPGVAGRWMEGLTVAGRCNAGAKEGTGRVSVYLPSGYTVRRRWPLAIALHGWQHSPEDWKGLGLAELADRHGVVLVLPDMGSSVFEAAFYPETRRAWGAVPGACWIGEVVLPWARRSLAVSRDRAHTAILGYSTGGRGALVVAGRYPRFAFAGSLSGTFDLGRLDPDEPEYAVHEAVFGPRPGREGRWREEDVWPLLTRLSSTSLFLAHGAEDHAVGPDQLQALLERLSPRPAPFLAVEVGGAGHDAAFWRMELPALFSAMAEALRPQPVLPQAATPRARSATPDPPQGAPPARAAAPHEPHSAPGLLRLDGQPTEVRWTDGDTFRIDSGPLRGFSGRLRGCNALEAYGPVHRIGSMTPEALQAIAVASAGLVARGEWRCTTAGKRDGYGRALVDCPEAAAALVRAGHAMVFSLEGRADPALLAAQREAQEARAGMWAGGVPPLLLSSVHSADERGLGKAGAYDRVVDTRTGAAPVRRHQRTYTTCQEVCVGAGPEQGCMVYVPFERRYRDRPGCLGPRRPAE